MAAKLGGAGDYVDYAASKGAIDTLTVGLAKEVGAEGIRVNAVRPGVIRTEIHATSGDPARVERIAATTPLLRRRRGGGSRARHPLARVRRSLLHHRRAARRLRRALAWRAAYALLGPTASGKSALALKLAAKLPVEIVSLDSALVYRGMDIGTAKPGAELRAQVPHHLIDIIDPDQSYSAGRWREDAIRIVGEILGRKKIPLLVGGTMLYYRALIAGLDALPQADARVRAEIDAERRSRGWPALHAELAQGRSGGGAAHRAERRAAHPARARSLEAHRQAALRAAGRGARRAAVRAQGHCPGPGPGAAASASIERRFDAMLRMGLVDEVKGLRKKYRLDASMPSMRAVGYRQVWEFLEGETDEATMREPRGRPRRASSPSASSPGCAAFPTYSGSTPAARRIRR